MSVCFVQLSLERRETFVTESDLTNSLLVGIKTISIQLSFRIRLKFTNVIKQINSHQLNYQINKILSGKIDNVLLST